MVNIYDHSWKTDIALAFIGKKVAQGTAYVAARPKLQKRIKNIPLIGTTIIDVNKEIDTYNAYYVTKAELVDRKNLSATQRLNLAQDPPYHSGPLYAVTMSSLEESTSYLTRLMNIGRRLLKKQTKHSYDTKQRQFYMNDQAYNQLGIERPTIDKAVQAEGALLSPKVFNVDTTHQYWGNQLPHVKGLNAKSSSKQQRNKIKEALQRPTKSAPKWGFMNPKP